MTTAILEAPSTHETKPRVRKPARTNARPVARKVKVTLVLDEEQAKRLATFAVHTDQDRSSVVNQLVREHLRRFRVQDLERSESAPPTEEVSAG